MPNGKRGLLLTDCAHSGNPFWPTPQKENFRSRGGKRINEMGLDRAVKAYPTPTSSMMTEADLIQAKFHSSKRPKYSAARLYPSPSSTDFRTGYRLDSEAGILQREKRQKPLRDDVAPGGQLNPDWVEWLMGWPIGWTALDSSIEIISLDWSADPADTGEVGRVTTGIKNRPQRLQAIGNGQVPLCFAIAWLVLANARRKL